MSNAFVTTVPVRFEHVDMAGIVFYPRYFEMVNQAVENWFAEALDCDFRRLHADLKLAIPTTHFDVHFDAPSRLGDQLSFALTVPQLGNSSFTLHHAVSCESQQRLRITQRLVCCQMDGMRPVRIPAEIRECMAHYHDG
ncbi:MAG: acyl-CoA thioesterase [Proteobacteria bacterium]|nr:MAG: acyl-CoA thioesterase [Pseudomonadota bacterium]QKK10520.1 MAG: acyl-CoA thioesterase [Pseudomonadota bacterium]